MNDKPVVSITYCESDISPIEYINFPVHTGLGLRVANQFLRELNTGLEIRFKNFKQYNELIHEINDLVCKNHKKV